MGRGCAWAFGDMPWHRRSDATMVVSRARYTRIPSPLGSPIMNKQLITTDPEIHSGAAVFAGTRVPIRTLFDHLEAGDSLEVFLDDFPSVSREVAVAILEEAQAALLPDAHSS